MGHYLIAREGARPLIIAAILALISALLGFELLCFVFVIILLVLLYMYRDPERSPRGYLEDGALLAPCDGQIVDINIGEVDGVRMSSMTIEVGIFDAGTIRSIGRSTNMHYSSVKGLCLGASIPAAKELNGFYIIDSTLVYEGLVCRYKIAQASLPAHIYHEPRIMRGGRIGFMKRGSLTLSIAGDIYTPSVHIGEKLCAGESIIGYARRL